MDKDDHPLMEIAHGPERDIKLNPMIIHDRLVYTKPGAMMFELVRRGMVERCMLDSLDELGEPRYRMMTPEELVARSVGITECAFAALEARGWVVSLPSIDELRADDSGIGFIPKAAA